jgi:DNA-binding NarL/FixJ family response regulator
LRQIEVLVAVEPEALLKLIEHLLQRPEFRVVRKVHEWPELAKQTSRLHPRLVITNARLLGNQAASILSALKFSSPRSKVIFISFPHDLSRQARQWGADAYLKEESLVQRLVPTALKLMGQPVPETGRSRRPAAPARPRASSRETSSTKTKANHFC